MLIAMSGLPGAGKSMVADALGRELRAPVLSVDPIEAALWRAGVDRAQPTGYAAYAVADAQARSLLALDGWIAVAREVRVPLRVVEVVCSDLDLHAERLARRDRGLGPELEPDWDRVLERRAESEPWPVDHLTLDSVDDPAANLTRALAYVADMAR
jgi:hypothetical protein